MGDQADRLFLSRDCPDCALVRATIDMNAVMDDDFRGTAGQELRVFSALSNQATRELLDRFGLEGVIAPVIVKADGTRLEKPKQIVQYLRLNGMAMK